MTLKRPGAVILMLLSCAAAGDQTESFRQRFSLVGKLEVLSVQVTDDSAVDGPVRVTMRCRLDQVGSYVFHFDPVRPDGRADAVTVVSPAPATSPFQAVLPGGIHGGPPRVMPGGPAPTVSRDANDLDVVTVRWGYADVGGRGGMYGMKLASCTFEAATTRPATAPSR